MRPQPNIGANRAHGGSPRPRSSLVADDKQQAGAARSVIETGEVFITTTAFLESGWVLHSAYGFSTGEIAAALRGLTGPPGVTVEKSQAPAQALDWCAGGMDLADALHLVKAEGCRSFLTFDHRLATVAKGLSSITVENP